MKQSKSKLVLGCIVGIVAVLGTVLFLVLNATPKYQKQLNKGNEYFAKMDYENAIVAFEKAIELNEECVEAYIAIADTYVALDNLDKAIEYLENGYSKTSDDSLFQKANLLKTIQWITKGNKSLAAEDLETAKSAFEEALKLTPDNTEAQNGLAECLRLMEEKAAEEARKAAEEAEAKKSGILFDFKDFKLFDYPIIENHIDEWVAACGYTGGGSVQAIPEYGYVIKAGSDRFGIMGKYDGTSLASYISYWTAASEPYKAQISINKEFMYGYDEIADAIFNGPIELGDTFADVRKLIKNYDGEIPIVPDEKALLLDDGTSVYTYNSTTLSGNPAKALGFSNDASWLTITFENDIVVDMVFMIR